MSAQDNHTDHHSEKGGHELDVIDTKILFKLVFGLSALVLLSCILVAEWFYRQNAAIQAERAQQEDAYILRSQVQAEVKEETKDLDKVINAMVSAPELLNAQNAPAGWVHPDDVKKAGDKPAEKAE